MVRPPPGEPTRDPAGGTEQGPTQGPELLSCPTCGAPNSPHRVLCGRCGDDLETGESGVAPRPTPARSTPGGTDELPPTRSRSRRAWVVVVVLGALIGSAIGLVVWLRSDDGGTAADARPAFAPALYTDDPQELQVAQVSASSRLSPEGSISYEPAQAIDGDPTTAWNEGAEGSGEGEQLRLDLTGPSWVERIVLRNGYQKDDRAFFDNARAARVLVRFDAASYVVDLADQVGEQAVTLPEPTLTTSVVVEVVEAIPGQQYDDLAISEIGLIGWPAREPGPPSR